ncbi:MAG: hypothetical protein Phyf2KO_21840 [Phycisphaerales bacterium]
MNSKTLGSIVLAGLVSGSAGAQDVITTFDNGNEGWSVSGRDDISATGGNPGANMDVFLLDVFGAETRNNTNTDFLGDYTRYGNSIELTVDVKINSIHQGFNPGFELPRELVVDVRDYDNDNGYPWTSVWFTLGLLHAPTNSDWATYSVIIDDTSATDLPAGWGGYGDEDPNTFEPVLPDGRTFASVLSSVDELAFTTFVPGFFFGFTNFDMQVDNVGIRTIPAPASLGLVALGGLAASRRRR